MFRVARPTSRMMRVRPADEPDGFDSPDGIDGAMGIGSRHSYRSDHLRFISASENVDAIAKTQFYNRIVPAVRGIRRRLPEHQKGSQQTPGPGEVLLLHCQKRDNAMPIRSPLLSTSPGSSSNRR